MHDIRGAKKSERQFLRRRDVQAIRAELVGDAHSSNTRENPGSRP